MVNAMQLPPCMLDLVRALLAPCRNDLCWMTAQTLQGYVPHRGTLCSWRTPCLSLSHLRSLSLGQCTSPARRGEALLCLWSFVPAEPDARAGRAGAKGACKCQTWIMLHNVAGYSAAVICKCPLCCPRFHHRWQGIQSSGELRRMSRTHIHFATLPHHMRGNNWAQILLRLDLQVCQSSPTHFLTA
jgi:hypothetical protein